MSIPVTWLEYSSLGHSGFHCPIDRIYPRMAWQIARLYDDTVESLDQFIHDRFRLSIIASTEWFAATPALSRQLDMVPPNPDGTIYFVRYRDRYHQTYWCCGAFVDLPTGEPYLLLRHSMFAMALVAKRIRDTTTIVSFEHCDNFNEYTAYVRVGPATSATDEFTLTFQARMSPRFVADSILHQLRFLGYTDPELKGFAPKTSSEENLYKVKDKHLQAMFMRMASQQHHECLTVD